jgi:hypothetical protein
MIRLGGLSRQGPAGVGGEEGLQLRRVVLAVAIERDDRLDPVVEGRSEARSQRGALALVRRLAQNARAGTLGNRGGLVARAVVDDEDGQVPQRRAHDGLDPGRLVVGRDQGDDPAARPRFDGWHRPILGEVVLRVQRTTVRAAVTHPIADLQTW